MAGGGATRRLFFALWPPAAALPEILHWVHDAHAVCGGRPMRPDTLHMTLAFLGAVPAEQAERLARIASAWSVCIEPLILRCFGRFPGPKIVWAGPSGEDTDCIRSLRLMHESLWSRLEALGWPRPAEGFRPHMSLLRKAGPGDIESLSRPPLTWTPKACVLVASEPGQDGSRYRVLARLQSEHRIGPWAANRSGALSGDGGNQGGQP
jgi:2'-5' RNA ligase